MKRIIERNEVKVRDFNIPAGGFIPNKAVLRDISEVRKKENDKLTDIVEAIRYDCVDPQTFCNFTVKVYESVPCITAKELEASEQAVLVEIPVDKTVLRPYAVEYGVVKVSIIAPYIKLTNK
jgi:hypothetical protein